MKALTTILVTLVASVCAIAGAETMKTPAGCFAAEGAKAGPHGYADRIVHEKTGIEMILIPAGAFKMGSNDPSGTSQVMPERQVTITRPFYMGKTEVTNGQYRRFIEANPDYIGEDDVDPAYDLYLLHFKGKSVMSAEDEYPVVWASWHNAKAFCAWAGLELPSEAQWEYACRAGTTTKFSFGDDLADIPKYAWADLAAGHRTHPVATKLPNPWGLYDMHGNVWEWCADDYIYRYDDAPADGSIRRDPNSQTKPLRGGSWSTGPARSLSRTPGWFHGAALGSLARFNVAPGNAWHDRGFRVIVPLTTLPALPIPAPSPAAGQAAPVQPSPAGVLVGHYTFEEGRGDTVEDSSGRANHGANKGARYVRLGPDKGFALSFDSLQATVDFGDRPDFDLGSALTLEMWVLPKALLERREIAVAGKGFNSYLLSFTGSLWFYINGGANHCSANVGLDQWRHIAATYDRQTMRLYLDGKEVAQRAQNSPVSKAGHFYLRPPLPSDEEIEKPWAFTLDDVRIYNRALSADEVATHHEEEAAGKR